MHFFLYKNTRRKHIFLSKMILVELLFVPCWHQADCEPVADLHTEVKSMKWTMMPGAVEDKRAKQHLYVVAMQRPGFTSQAMLCNPSLDYLCQSAERTPQRLELQSLIFKIFAAPLSLFLQMSSPWLKLKKMPSPKWHICTGIVHITWGTASMANCTYLNSIIWNWPALWFEIYWWWRKRNITLWSHAALMFPSGWLIL